MRLMNKVFRLYVSKFIMVYFDDNLIYSKSKSEHLDHLTQITMVLNQDKLFVI